MSQNNAVLKMILNDEMSRFEAEIFDSHDQNSGSPNEQEHNQIPVIGPNTFTQVQRQLKDVRPNFNTQEFNNGPNFYGPNQGRSEFRSRNLPLPPRPPILRPIQPGPEFMSKGSNMFPPPPPPPPSFIPHQLSRPSKPPVNNSVPLKLAFLTPPPPPPTITKMPKLFNPPLQKKPTPTIVSSAPKLYVADAKKIETETKTSIASKFAAANERKKKKKKKEKEKEKSKSEEKQKNEKEISDKKAEQASQLVLNTHEASLAIKMAEQVKQSTAVTVVKKPKIPAVPKAFAPPSKIPKNLKKLKKKLRYAGGRVWEDSSLDDWDKEDFRLFIGDLGNDVTDDLLTRTFCQYSSFVRAKVVRDKRTNKTKGYGFLSFKEPEDYIRAIRDWSGKYLGSRPIKLRKSTWKDRSLENVQKKLKEKKMLGLK